MRRPLLILELTAPGQVIAWRQFDLAGNLRLRFINKAHQVTTTDVGNHHAVATPGLALHLDRAFFSRQAGNSGQRHTQPVRSQYVEAGEGFRRYPNIGRAAHQNRYPTVAVHHHPGFFSFHLQTQGILHVADIQAQTPSCQSIHLQPQILYAAVLYGVDILRAGNFFQYLLHLLGQRIQGVQIRAKHFQRQITAHADNHLGNTHLNRLREAVNQTGKSIQHLTQAVQQRFLVTGHAPLFFRLQLQKGIGLIDTHRVEADFIGTGPRHDAGHFRHFFHYRLLKATVQGQCLGQTDRWLLLDTDDHIAFVHRRHEGLADLGIDRSGSDQQHQRPNNDGCRAAQAGGQQRGVQAQQLARQPRIGVVIATQQEGGQHRNNCQ